MKTRNLGSSGLKISEIAYGNWLTHGSQVEEDAATACVRRALDEGITTFDTADVYANTEAETVLGEALKGERREGLEIFTKVYWPTGPGKHNDHGLSRKHILESIDGSLTRLQTDYVDLYQAHRYDHETPLEETMEAFADVVRQGKALYIGVSEWRAEEIRAAHALARELQIPLVSNQPQYSMLWRVIEAEVVPTSEELGIGQIVWSPIAQGVLTGKYLPGPARARGEPGDRRQGRRRHDQAAGCRTTCSSGSSSSSRSPTRPGCRSPSSPSPGCSRTTTSPPRSSAPAGPSRSPTTPRRPASPSTPATLKAIDDVVGPVVERDPAKTQSPRARDFSRARLAVVVGQLLPDPHPRLGQPHELHLQRPGHGVVGQALGRLAREARARTPGAAGSAAGRGPCTTTTTVPSSIVLPIRASPALPE